MGSVERAVEDHSNLCQPCNEPPRYSEVLPQRRSLEQHPCWHRNLQMCSPLPSRAQVVMATNWSQLFLCLQGTELQDERASSLCTSWLWALTTMPVRQWLRSILEGAGAVCSETMIFLGWGENHHHIRCGEARSTSVPSARGCKRELRLELRPRKKAVAAQSVDGEGGMGNSDFFPYKLWRIEICFPKEIKLDSREKEAFLSAASLVWSRKLSFLLIHPFRQLITASSTDLAFPLLSQRLMVLPSPATFWPIALQLNTIHDGEQLLSSITTNWDFPGSIIAVSFTSSKIKIKKIGSQENPEQQSSPRVWQMWLSGCSAGWAGDGSCLQDLGCECLVCTQVAEFG